MHGTIRFPDLKTLAEFLAEFSGKCTSVFEAFHDPQRNGGWIVEFSGGH